MKITTISCLVLLASLPLAGLAKDNNNNTGAARELTGLPALLRAVQEENPALHAARARWRAARARVPQERAWEDPEVGGDFRHADSSKLGGYTEREWMASQQIPISGKNLARGRAAAAEATAAREELRRVEHDVVFKTKRAYYRLANAYAQLDLNSRDTELLSQFSEITLAKYEVGSRPQSDVFAAEIELAKSREARSDLERDRSDQESELNALMNRPAHAPLPQPPPLHFSAQRQSKEAAEKTAMQNRPEILRSTRQIEAEKARVELARKMWFPDPNVLVRLRSTAESTRAIQDYDTAISFSVPWVNPRKYSAAVHEAQQAQEAATREYAAQRAETSSLVRDQLKKIETLAHHYELFKTTIVPLADQAVKSMRSSYESDKASFLELTDAQRNLREVESTLLGHLLEHEIAIAELHSIIGDDPDISTKPDTNP